MRNRPLTLRFEFKFAMAKHPAAWTCTRRQLDLRTSRFCLPGGHETHMIPTEPRAGEYANTQLVERMTQAMKNKFGMLGRCLPRDVYSVDVLPRTSYDCASPHSPHMFRVDGK